MSGTKVNVPLDDVMRLIAAAQLFSVGFGYTHHSLFLTLACPRGDDRNYEDRHASEMWAMLEPYYGEAQACAAAAERLAAALKPLVPWDSLIAQGREMLGPPFSLPPEENKETTCEHPTK